MNFYALLFVLASGHAREITVVGPMSMKACDAMTSEYVRQGGKLGACLTEEIMQSQLTVSNCVGRGEPVSLNNGMTSVRFRCGETT